GVEQVAAIGVAISPARAILAAARPALVEPAAVDFVGNNVTWYLLTSAVATVLLNAIAVWRVRIWNPSREARPAPTADASSGTIWGPEHGLDQTSDPALAAEAARAGHVDAQVARHGSGGSGRTVWRNPILWREMRTAAYGRKLIFIRLAYLLIFV